MTKILCLDDEPRILGIYEGMFRTMDGVNVVTAANGKEGLALFETAPEDYGLILTDYEMPEMDGLEFLRHIRVFEQPPRVMLSGRVDADLQRRVRTLGAEGVIAKPFTSEFVRTVAEELLATGKSGQLITYITRHYF